MRPPISSGRIVLSWLAIGVGLFAGIMALARFGAVWLPHDHDLLRWIGYFGVALFATTFLVGSIIALRNPKRAGFTFLAFMPIAVFCLAYPSAGYLVWHPDGGGWFETPLILTAVGLTVSFFLPIYAAVLALRHRKRTTYCLFAFTVFLAAIVFAMSHWTRAFLPPFAGCTAPFLAFGLFWRETNLRGWSPLLQCRHDSLFRRMAIVVLTCLVILCVDVVATFGLYAIGSTLFSGDCHGKPLIVRPESSHHAVFTARLVFVGRSLEALTREGGVLHNPEIPGSRDPRVGDWGIGIVQERFWGLPAWSRLVLLTNNIYWKGETYFIDGSREQGIVSRVLPIVDGRTGCSRTRRTQDAIVDLRALRGTSSSGGARLMGYVREPESFVFGLAPPTRSTFAVGAGIIVTGPNGTRMVTTDQTGIYELDNLASGDYTLQLLIPDSKVAGFFEQDGSPAKLRLTALRTEERSFDLFWNGRIEGHVRDGSGKPLQVLVRLLTPNGIRVPGYVVEDVLSAADGSYQLKKIPPGRYRVMINDVKQGGTSAIQFYPAKLHLEDAQWLELSEGQRITGIDFTIQ